MPARWDRSTIGLLDQEHVLVRTSALPKLLRCRTFHVAMWDFAERLEGRGHIDGQDCEGRQTEGRGSRALIRDSREPSCWVERLPGILAGRLG